jgi:hypothetical protein
MRNRLLRLSIALACLAPALTAASSATAGAGRIVATGSMSVPRQSAAAALLSDGKVLVAGGMPANGVFLSSAELYDPARGTFSPAGNMQSIRGFGATATRLTDGSVLLAGGRAKTACTNSAERYSEQTSSFVRTGDMHVARCGAFALSMPGRHVLIVGGNAAEGDAHPLTSVEEYDEQSGRFTLGGSTSGDTTAAILLKNGSVLVVHEATAELYDPATARFSPAGALITPRHKTGAALLPDGRVILFGGQTENTWGPRERSTEIFDPVTLRFTRGPEMLSKRYKLRWSVVPLGDGRIVIAGGADRPEVYDPASHDFTPATGDRLDSYFFSSAIHLANGNILIAGGYGSDYTTRNHAWLYTP